MFSPWNFLGITQGDLQRRAKGSDPCPIDDLRFIVTLGSRNCWRSPGKPPYCLTLFGDPGQSLSSSRRNPAHSIPHPQQGTAPPAYLLCCTMTNSTDSVSHPLPDCAHRAPWPRFRPSFPWVIQGGRVQQEPHNQPDTKKGPSQHAAHADTALWTLNLHFQWQKPTC